MGERNKTVKKKRTKQNSKKICFVLHSYPFLTSAFYETLLLCFVFFLILTLIL